MGKHVAVLGFIHLVLGGLSAVGGVLLLLFSAGGGFLGLISGDESLRFGMGLVGLLGGAMGVAMLLGGLLGLLTAYGLLGRFGWGRLLGIISSVLWVLNFSWTSLIGIYGLWVLLSKEGAREFSRPR